MPTVVSLALEVDTVQTIVSKWKIAWIGQQQQEVQQDKWYITIMCIT